MNSREEQNHTDGEDLFDKRWISPEEELRTSPHKVFTEADGRGCNRSREPDDE